MPEDGTSPSDGWRAVYGAMAVPTSAEESLPDIQSPLDERRSQDPGTDTDSGMAGRVDHARADD